MKKEFKLDYDQFDSWKELSNDDQSLIEEARFVMKSAYAPYSKFSVGAAARLNNGIVVKGSNQENIAYPSGLCAERVALFYAGANYPDNSVETLAIVAEGDLVPKETILSPCGSCRQVMVETETRQNKKYRVLLVSQNGQVVVFQAAVDLLPLAFGV